jgi:membrane protease YdiL (CAAX protease family)
MRTYARDVAIFYGIVLSLSVAIALFLAPLIGGYALMVVMTTPLVGVLIMKLLVTREGWRKEGWSDLGLFSLGLSAWPMAIGLTFVVLLFSYGIVWATGIAGFAVPEGLIASLPAFGLNVLMALLLAFGEEIGWRGYLLPRLMPLGHRRALLLSGLAQAIWHTPFMLFTTLYHGDGNLWLTIPLFLSTLTVAGILFGYLRLTSGSVWPAAIAHWTFNVYWWLFTAFTINGSALALEYLAGETGILSLTAVIFFAVVLLRRYEAQNRTARPATA